MLYIYIYIGYISYIYIYIYIYITNIQATLHHIGPKIKAKTISYMGFYLVVKINLTMKVIVE